MHSQSLEGPHGRDIAPSGADAATAASLTRVLACVDGSEQSNRVVAHATAIADALHLLLALLRVLEASGGPAPQDPVEWSIRRRKALERIEELVNRKTGSRDDVERIVVDGQAVEQICRRAYDPEVAVTVIGTSNGQQCGPNLGGTTHKLLDRARGTVLLVPSSVPDTPLVVYKRLLVPLDGSCRAESVLPMAMRLAKAEEAEIVLAHVVPEPELTEIGPLESRDLILRDQVIRRNEKVARHYVGRLRVSVAAQGIPVRDLILRGGDVRAKLARTIAEEAVDLVILSAHGKGDRPDVACGSVAAHLLTHLDTPVLICLRPRGESEDAMMHADWIGPHHAGRPAS